MPNKMCHSSTSENQARKPDLESRVCHCQTTHMGKLIQLSSLSFPPMNGTVPTSEGCSNNIYVEWYMARNKFPIHTFIVYFLVISFLDFDLDSF